MRRLLARRLAQGDHGRRRSRARGARRPRWPRAASGAGTGMMCFDFPGGIGTASRAVGEHHVGVLLLCNFGDRERLDLLGTSARPTRIARSPPGGVVHLRLRHRRARSMRSALRRLALRALLGLVRVGSYGQDGSGEIGLAFSTGGPGDARHRRPRPVLRGRLGGGAGGRLQLPGRRAAGADARRDDAGRLPDRARSRARGGAPRERVASQLRDEVVELARDLIRVDTSNPPGNETPAAELLAAYLRGPGSSRSSWSARIPRGST